MINRQAAFGGQEKLRKGALHCHTTRSDGHGEPADVIRLHKAHGYGFMALTDHNIYNAKNFAPDVEMTIIPGTERDRLLPGNGGVHVFHTVCLGPETGNGYVHDQRFDGSAPVADQAAYQAELDEIHSHGNMTIYCHPEWSHTPSSEFDQLRGNFAMEIWNSGCVMDNDYDDNAYGWDDLLLAGQRIWGVATDDGHPMRQHGRGWVMVRAENSVDSILAALKDGAFYATCGPEIYDFYVEDGMAVLTCSPCTYAGFRHGRLPYRLRQSQKGDVTRVAFEVPPFCTYIRGVVRDAQGRRAWTNPIFL